MIQTNTTNRNQPWSLNLRSKVGDIVTHNQEDWINVTGSNGEPSVTIDWVALSGSTHAVILINGNPISIIKAPTNNNPANRRILEANDILVNGFVLPNVFWERAIFNGGNVSNIDTLSADFDDGDYTRVKYVTI